MILPPVRRVLTLFHRKALVAGRTRLLALLSAAVICAAPATGASGAKRHRGPLTGTWSGTIGGSGTRPVRIVIVIDAAETGGSWRLTATCRGRLTLDSISGGYHHYLRHFAGGANCAGGDIDCLKRVGANVYDAVTSRHSGEYGTGGTLRRARAGTRAVRNSAVRRIRVDVA